MDGLHWPDLLVLIAVGLLVFGPKRLPEMGAAVGKALREFRAAMRGDVGQADTLAAEQTMVQPLPAAVQTERAADAASTNAVPTPAQPEAAPRASE